MNLLDSVMEPCVMIDRVTVSDGQGGFIESWQEGATFEAFVRKESAPEITVAEQQGVREIFTVVVRKGVPLSFHDVFRRIGDSEVFRVTSNVLDDAAPAASSIPIAKANCERWVLT